MRTKQLLYTAAAFLVIIPICAGCTHNSQETASDAANHGMTSKKLGFTHEQIMAKMRGQGGGQKTNVPPGAAKAGVH